MEPSKDVASAPVHSIVMRLRAMDLAPCNEAADEIERLRSSLDWIVDEIHQGVMHANGLRDVSLTHESQIQSDGMLKAWSQAATIAKRGKERANKSA